MPFKRLAFAFIALFVLLIGPWPVDETHFQQSQYAKNTFEHIKNLNPDINASLIKAGTASVEITPLPGSPLAGYSARDPKANTGAIEKLFAKAISISNNTNTTTLLSADLLLPMPELVTAIVKKTGLQRNQIYFSTTHTHSGPGGYANGIIETASMGDFSQKQFDMLVNSLSSAVIKSRENLQTVKIKYTRLELTPSFASQFIHNQLYDIPQAHNSIHALEFKTVTRNMNETNRLATLITFSAHPTFLGRINRKLSGDYPGVLMRKLEKSLGGNVMFSVGAVGSMLPVSKEEKEITSIEIQKKKLNTMGESLAHLITKSLMSSTEFDKSKVSNILSWSSSEVTIQSEVIPIELPFPNYRLSDNLRLSPFLVNAIFHDNDTFIHALKIGKLFFLSYPADYSGELATSLEQWANDKDVYPWATSFNGEYIGYILPSRHYDKNHYSVRDVNFYGRWAGDFFLETSKQIIVKLK